MSGQFVAAGLEEADKVQKFFLCQDVGQTDGHGGDRGLNLFVDVFAFYSDECVWVQQVLDDFVFRQLSS